MKVDLSGKAIAITGAARGIGAAIARHAAAAGATDLLLTDRDEAEGADIFRADLMDTDAPDRIIAETIARFGRIDALVNAAGLTTRASFLDATPAIWDSVTTVNQRAPFFLMSHAIQAFRAQGTPGSIVNIQSMNAHCGAPDLAIYAATKGALQTMTKNAANAHLADGIRVNGINLGWVATESEDHMQSQVLGHGPDWQAKAAATLPLGRLVTEDEAARLAIYLLSDASAPMTGASIDLEQQIIGAPQ